MPQPGFTLARLSQKKKIREIQHELKKNVYIICMKTIEVVLWDRKAKKATFATLEPYSKPNDRAVVVGSRRLAIYNYQKNRWEV